MPIPKNQMLGLHRLAALRQLTKAFKDRQESENRVHHDLVMSGTAYRAGYTWNSPLVLTKATYYNLPEQVQKTVGVLELYQVSWDEDENQFIPKDIGEDL